MSSPVVRSRDPKARADRRDDILRAAGRCLAQLGYDGVRLRDVAHACGLSIGALQHHFETREQLLEQAFEHSSKELIEQWAELTRDEPDPWQRLVALIMEVTETPDMRSHCLRWCEFCVASARVPSLVPGVRRIEAAWRAHVVNAVGEGCATGRFRPRRTPDDAVDVIMLLVDGAELNVAAGLSDLTPQRFRSVVLGAVSAELGVDGGTAQPCPP